MDDRFITEAWTELAIAWLVIILRLYASFDQRRLKKGMTIDDGLMVLVGAFCTSEITAAYFAVVVYLGRANNNVLPELRTHLDQNSQEWRYSVNGSKTHIFGWFMYIGLFWTLKCCLTLYYTRLTKEVNSMKVSIRLAWAFNGITFIVAICIVIFKCWPLHRQWQISPDPGNNCYPGASVNQIYVVTAMNLVTDAYLIYIPIRILCPVQISLRRKIFLCILLSGGGVVMAFDILRCLSLVSVSATQPSQSGQWSVRESLFAIIISNGPTVYPLFKKWFNILDKKVLTHSKSSRSASYPLGSVEATGSSRRQTRLDRYLNKVYGSDEALTAGHSTYLEAKTSFNEASKMNVSQHVIEGNCMTSSDNNQHQGSQGITVTAEVEIHSTHHTDETSIRSTEVRRDQPMEWC